MTARYESRSVERPLAAPRAVVWPRLLGAVRSDLVPVAEISVEAPWRLVIERDPTPHGLSFWQQTFLLRDDGPTCHLAIGLVFDPEPDPAGMQAIDRVVAEADAWIRALRIV